MATSLTPARPVTTAVVTASNPGLDWSAAIGGALIASALSVVLIAFGSGLGLSAVSPEPGESVGAAWISIAAGFWFVWVAVSSFAAGGYFAGRVRRAVEVPGSEAAEHADGAHGLLVWAIGALVGAILAVSGVSGVAGATASAIGGGAGTVAEALGDQASYFAGRILQAEDGAAVGDAETRDRIAGVLARSLTQAELSQADRDYIGSLVAAGTGGDPAATTARIDAVVADLQTAREEAVDAIETARVAGVIAAFTVAATLLVSAVAAYSAAGFGGRHREDDLHFFRGTLTPRR